jgi:hypothetical protein
MPDTEYRKKPVVIEARQLTQETRDEVAAWCGGVFEQAAPSGTVYAPGVLRIRTLEGDHWADWGDFIIRGVQGEFYPCKPDIFEQTYERADARPMPDTDLISRGEAATLVAEKLAEHGFCRAKDDPTCDMKWCDDNDGDCCLNCWHEYVKNILLDAAPAVDSEAEELRRDFTDLLGVLKTCNPHYRDKTPEMMREWLHHQADLAARTEGERDEGR